MKQKTKKSAAKRFKFTATGKVKMKRTGLRHNLGKHTRATKVKRRGKSVLTSGDESRVHRMLVYGA